MVISYQVNDAKFVPQFTTFFYVCAYLSILLTLLYVLKCILEYSIVFHDKHHNRSLSVHSNHYYFGIPNFRTAEILHSQTLKYTAKQQKTQPNHTAKG